ncbi:MAG: RnfABCDGE type electron transport complex subunit G [Bacteroidales bacterium]|nr:RnfABCDGE type electron transport complex subunit G [Bacteroidales bacterium]
MAKLQSTFKNMFLVLVIFTAVAAALLAMVNEVTKAPIAASEKAKQENAIKVVLPEFDNSPTEEKYLAKTVDGDSLLVFPAKKGGKYVGSAVASTTKKGFSGLVKIMVGFNADGTLYNYSVLHHAETPGLGSKIQDWFSDKLRPSSCVIGKNPEKGLKVSKDGGEVDAITAATISSRAFLDAINRAYSTLNHSVNVSDTISLQTNN